jgi:hypothetical protein
MMTAATATDARRVVPATISLVPGAIAIGRPATFSALMRARPREVGP